MPQDRMKRVVSHKLVIPTAVRHKPTARLTRSQTLKLIKKESAINESFNNYIIKGKKVLM